MTQNWRWPAPCRATASRAWVICASCSGRGCAPRQIFLRGHLGRH
jgi:hypothetical protein